MTNCHKDDEMANRFEDNQELKYSLRSVWVNAPWIRRIYLVTNGQIPNWLNINNPKLYLVPHSSIFKNQSHLPTFSSPSIEANIHRIPGLSEHFIYLNDDVMFGNTIHPSDFYTSARGQRIYLSWDVPDCNEGCSSSWIGDGHCDISCNVSNCDFDGNDCKNVSYNSYNSYNYDQYNYNQYNYDSSSKYCSTGCMENWIGDRYCDKACKNPSCGYDAGDCGFDLVFENLVGFSLFENQTSKVFLSELPVMRLQLPKYDSKSSYRAIYFNLSWMNDNFSITEVAHSESFIIRSSIVSQQYKTLILLFREDINEKDKIFISISSKIGKNQKVVENMFYFSVFTNVTTNPKNFTDLKNLTNPNNPNNPKDSNVDIPNEEKSKIDFKYLKPNKKDFLNEKRRIKNAGTEGIDYITENYPWDEHENNQFEVDPSLGHRLKDNYGDSLKYVNKLLNKAFGLYHRKVPAHMPHYIQKSIMERLQAKWPKEFDETSSHPLRHPKDMQYSFSYYYYLMHERLEYNFTKIFYQVLDVNHDGLLDYTELRTLSSTIVRSKNPTEDIYKSYYYENQIPDEPESKLFQNCNFFKPSNNITEKNNTSTSYINSNKKAFARNIKLSKEQIENCTSAMKLIKSHFSLKLRNKFELGDLQDVAFVMLRTNKTLVLRSLDGIRDKHNKYICLNDNMNHSDPHSLLVIEAVHDLYKSLYPFPSPFELPEGEINKFSYIDDILASRSIVKKRKNKLYLFVFILILILITIVTSLMKKDICENSLPTINKIKNN